MGNEIWCTLGPASLNDRVISRLEELGVSLFRLNLSHTRIELLEGILDFIQARSAVPVSLDTEGAQVRTAELAAGKIAVGEAAIIRVHHDPVPGDAAAFNLHPHGIARQLLMGDLLKIDAEVLAQVIGVERDGVVLRVLHGGEIGQNKAVTVLERDIAMPALTEKDERALAIGRRKGIQHVALSFANRAADVDEIRVLAGPDVTVTSKIECLNGLRNLAEIAERSDALLIDRGDLSRQVGIEKIPTLQKDIIRVCRSVGRRIYVATNLLESMVTSPNPTRAEVNDSFNTLMDGADGLVLAAETAIGAHPVAAVQMLRKVIREYEDERRLRSSPPGRSLAGRHGDLLDDRDARCVDRQSLGRLRTLRVSDVDLIDCVQIAHGAYSPLVGFMGSKELESVLDKHRLLDGSAWTLPIVLRVPEDSLAGVAIGERVALAGPAGDALATLDVAEAYSFDLEELAHKWFGTTSSQHPGVAQLMRGGHRFVAGPVTRVEKMAWPHGPHALSPSQLRSIFAQKGWSKVVGFHAEHASPRLHEYVRILDLPGVHADGMYVGWAGGPRESDDRAASGRLLLGRSVTQPRHCGPREAVFNALCYRNLGCSHFVVERSYLEVDGFYEDARTRELFEQLGDIGIAPIFVDF
jgi:pyruvate kinase